MRKKKIKKIKMIYSAGSITRNGFNAFLITPLFSSPIKISIPIINENENAANNMITKNNFKVFTYIIVIYILFVPFNCIYYYSFG